MLIRWHCIQCLAEWLVLDGTDKTDPQGPKLVCPVCDSTHIEEMDDSEIRRNDNGI